LVWGRLWGGGNSAIRSTPICLLPRDELEPWLALSGSTVANGGEQNGEALSTYAKSILLALDARGASFTRELERSSKLLASHFEMGLVQLIGHGLVPCDSFGGFRRLVP